jgi:hypothetical protein
MTKIRFILFTASLLLTLMAGQALALHPEMKIPDRVDAGHKACRELLRLAMKYEVEGTFPKGFEDGSVSCARLDVALALYLITEQVAEKAAKEGPGVVAREDIEFLSDLREELRGEMLLVQARTFQQRRDELGTRLHALTKEITISGGFTGVLQGSIGNEPKDHADVVGRGDLVFNFKVGENTLAVIDVEATGGDGLDAKISNFSLLNGVAGSTGDRVRFREAWLEHAAFDDRMLLTIGKIDLTNYFDTNSIANDENSQYLAGAFVNSAVLGAPPVGPGARVQAKLADSLVFGLGYASSDGDSADIFEHPYVIGEIDCKFKISGMEGNYRFYGNLDGTLPDGENKLIQKNAFGYGVSIDQQVAEKMTLFGRYGRRDKTVYKATSAWSLGFQYAGPIPSRREDMVALAYGQVRVNGARAGEKLAELYYMFKVSDQIAVTPVAQYLINPGGDYNGDNVVILGLRTQVYF